MTMETTTITEVDNEEYFEYLDGLRESGVTNMFGGAAYLVENFALDKKEAKSVLMKWMDTFATRHPETT